MEKILSMIGPGPQGGPGGDRRGAGGLCGPGQKGADHPGGRRRGGQLRAPAMGFANTGSCLCLVIPASKEELGRALGRTSCAMAAITDMGFADAIAKKLAALDPQRFGSAAERMAVKAQRARERKLEQLAHEKNVRMGKKRPPKPPEKAAPPEKEERREREKKPSRPGKRERSAAARSRQKSQARARFEGSRR